MHGPQHRIPLFVLMTVVLCGWAISVAVAARVQPPEAVAGAALALHLVALIGSLGALTLVDWHGLLWLSGRRGLSEVLRVSDAATPLAWAGYAGLLVSGALLSPDLSLARTWVKLGCVLLVGLNGVAVARLGTRLAPFAPDTRARNLPKSLRRTAIATTGISAGAWWTAATIGLIAHLSG